MKHYALVSECGRQLDCKFFENLEEATTELELTFKHCLQGRHSEAYIKEGLWLCRYTNRQQL